jgi:hypothetical protein
VVTSIADIRRFAIEAFQIGPTDVLERLLSVVSRALVQGTEDVRNAIAVSFVEDTGWWDPPMQSFIEILATTPQGRGARAASVAFHIGAAVSKSLAIAFALFLNLTRRQAAK